MNINSHAYYNIIFAICIKDHILFLKKHRYVDIGGMFVYFRANHIVINRNGSYTMNFNSKLVFGEENHFYLLSNDGLMYGMVSAIRSLNINGNTVTTAMLFNDSKSDSRLFVLSADKSFFVITNFGFQSNVDYPSFTETTTQKYSQNQFLGMQKYLIITKYILHFQITYELMLLKKTILMQQ